MSEVTDWRGNPIHVGSIVVYPVRAGSWHAVTEAEVTGIVKRPVPWHRQHLGRDWDPALRVRRIRTNGGTVDGNTTLTVLDRVTVVA